jgi:hypothetical protein
MGAVLALIQADGRNPFIDQPSILACAQVAEVVHAARKEETVNVAAASLQPCRHALSGFRHDLELHGFPRLLLDDGRSVPDVSTTDHVTDLEFDEVAATKLAIDRQIKQCPILQSPVLIEINPNGPDVARLQRAFGADILPSIPGAPFMHGRIKV